MPREALERHLLERKGEGELLSGVAKLFAMEAVPERIEVYDNSHISGTNMVGGMVVAGAEGFRKSAYRKFNIKVADKADDYGMMREVMLRRFGRAIKEETDRSGEDWPDLLLIDGGLGQFNAVKEVLQEMGVWEDLTVVAIAKGPDRNAGREQFLYRGARAVPASHQRSGSSLPSKITRRGAPFRHWRTPHTAGDGYYQEPAG